MKMKRCSRCKVEKDVSEFGKATRNSDGLNTWCKTCIRAHLQRLVIDPATGETVKASTLATRKFRADPEVRKAANILQNTIRAKDLVPDPEKPGALIRRSSLKIRNAAREIVTDPNTNELISKGALATRRFMADPEKRAQFNQKNRLRNQALVLHPDTGKLITTGALRHIKDRSNPGRREASQEASRRCQRARYLTGKYAAYLESNPVAKLSKAIAVLLRSSIRAKGWSKTTRTHALLGCSFEEFAHHIEQQFQEGMSWENWGDWHFDHSLPNACATDKIEFLALQHHSNFQPLWGAENLSKGGSLPDNWEELKQDLLDLLWHREGMGEINVGEYLE